MDQLLSGQIKSRTQIFGFKVHVVLPVAYPPPPPHYVLDTWTQLCDHMSQAFLLRWSCLGPCLFTSFFSILCISWAKKAKTSSLSGPGNSVCLEMSCKVSKLNFINHLIEEDNTCQRSQSVACARVCSWQECEAWRGNRKRGVLAPLPDALWALVFLSLL